MDFFSQPWPWYVAGPIIGLMVPIFLLLAGKVFGFSENLRHFCAACNVADVEFFRYDWKKAGGWNLTFLVGVVLGGFVGGNLLANPEPIVLAESTIETMRGWGLTDFSGFVPSEIFSWAALSNPMVIVVLAVGGFLVGFGARYAGGCTSGHAISGLADLQLASLLAVIGFFIGGLAMTYFLLPMILG